MNRTNLVIYIKIYLFQVLEKSLNNRKHFGILFFKKESPLDGLELKSLSLEPDFGLSIESDDDHILSCNFDEFNNEITLYKYKTPTNNTTIEIRNKTVTTSKDNDPTILN